MISDPKDIDPTLPYFGIIKAKLLAPRSLFLPLLPYRTAGRLMFTLCAKCATDLHQGECTCTDDQRAMIDIWTIEEVKQGIKRGYQLLQVYELYHYKDSTKYNPQNPDDGGLFQVTIKYTNHS